MARNIHRPARPQRLLGKRSAITWDQTVKDQVGSHSAIDTSVRSQVMLYIAVHLMPDTASLLSQESHQLGRWLLPCRSWLGTHPE